MSIIRRLLVLAVFFVPVTTSAGELSSILELLLSRGGKTASEAAIGGASTKIIKNITLDRTVIGTLGQREAGALDDAIERMLAASPPEKMTSRVGALNHILAQAHSGPNVLTHTAPFDDALPFIRIRATGDAIIDDALAAFARAKFDTVLAERFSVDDLRIVPLGMSDNETLSAAEIARYGRKIPLAQQDRFGPLAQLSAGDIAGIGEQQVAKLLVPYRGKTIILVGHVPEQTHAFFVTSAAGKKPIDLDAIMRAAETAEVNIIPIGCRSGQFAPIGAVEQISSDDVLERLLAIIEKNPHTIRDFLSALSGNDLVLLIDPTNLNIFNNTIEIVRKETSEVVGRILTNTSRETAQAGARNISPKLAPSYDVCFREVDKDGFASCSALVENNFKASMELQNAEREKQRAQEAQAYRARRLTELPAMISAAEASAEKAAYRWALAGTVYAILWVLSIVCVPWAYVVMSEQKETGVEFGALIANRRLFVRALTLFARPSFWTDNILLMFIFLLQLTIGAAVLLTIEPFIFRDLAVAVGFVGSISLGGETIRFVYRSLGEDQPANAAAEFAGVVIVIWLGSGWFYYYSDRPFWKATNEVTFLKDELSSITGKQRLRSERTSAGR
jgi:hypothetical protein